VSGILDFPSINVDHISVMNFRRLTLRLMKKKKQLVDQNKNQTSFSQPILLICNHYLLKYNTIYIYTGSYERVLLVGIVYNIVMAILFNPFPFPAKSVQMSNAMLYDRRRYISWHQG
jgi:hypothetical protein